MALQYAAWRSQSGLRAQYDMLILHISELQELAIGAGDISSEGKARGNSSAVSNLSKLIDKADEYARLLGIDSGAARFEMTPVRKRT